MLLVLYWLLLLKWGAVSAVPTQGKSRLPSFIPACDLVALNTQYVTRLNRLRRQLDPTAPLVRFDPNLFTGSVLHVAEMEAQDSLFHAYVPRYSGELVGEKRYVQAQDAGRIAQFALDQFEGSELHCQIQECAKYAYVAIAASAHFYIVRLSNTPLGADRSEQVAFKKLGLTPLVEQVEPKKGQRLIYRAF